MIVDLYSTNGVLCIWAESCSPIGRTVLERKPFYFSLAYPIYNVMINIHTRSSRAREKEKKGTLSRSVEELRFLYIARLLHGWYWNLIYRCGVHAKFKIVIILHFKIACVLSGLRSVRSDLTKLIVSTGAAGFNSTIQTLIAESTR